MIRRLVLLILLSISGPLWADTHKAASCTRTDVQAAFDAATEAGAVVVIPSCSGGQSWTASASWTAPTNAVLQGQTVCTGSGNPAQNNLACTDNTVIVDNFNSSQSLLNITTSNTGTFRFTGLTIRAGNAPAHDQGVMVFISGSHSFRIDHSHFDMSTGTGPNNGSQSTMTLFGDTNGVIDHNIFDLPGGPGQGIRTYGNNDPAGHGDTTWNAATGLGTSNFVFAEDNVFNGGFGTDANDCQISGRFVWRFNRTAGVQTHATGSSGRGRGCRAWEIYKNHFISTGGAQPQFAATFLTSGTGIVWGNSSGSGDQNGFKNFHVIEEQRRAGGSGCGGNRTYCQGATPDGWGYMGTSFNGTGSNWDGNTPSAVTGYPGLDQIGRGIGDLLSGQFPNVTNSTTGCNSSQSCAWPRQALEPVYEWLNTWTNPGWGGFFISNFDSDVIQANRDYYAYTASFDGTVGVGSGARSSRPSTCTTGVAWWSTDHGGNWDTRNASSQDGTLDKCTATNTWTNAAYTPFAYPHPLTETPAPLPTLQDVLILLLMLAVILLLMLAGAASLRLAAKTSIRKAA